MRGSQRDVDVAALTDRLSTVYRLEDGQLAGLLLDHTGDAIEVLRSLASRHILPVFVVRFARRLHRRVDRLFGTFGKFGRDLFGRRIDRLKILGILRLDELAADEVAVAFLVSGEIRSLRRGSVLPQIAEEQVFHPGRFLWLVHGGLGLNRAEWSLRSEP